MPLPLLIPAIGALASGVGSLIAGNSAQKQAAKQLEQENRMHQDFMNTMPKAMSQGELQNQANIDRANQKQDIVASRHGQSGPFGSTQWQGDNLVSTLGAGEQAKYDAHTGMLPTLLNNFRGGDTQQLANQMYDRFQGRMNPEFDRQSDRMKNQLLQQGFAPGSEAYNSEMNRLSQNQSDSRLDALNQAQMTSAGVNAQNMGTSLNLFNQLGNINNPMSSFIPGLGGNISGSYANAQNTNQSNLNRNAQLHQSRLGMLNKDRHINNATNAQLPNLLGNMAGGFTKMLAGGM
ncbi:hypothetical protein AGMMS49995_10910 [Endomicrobiia bacterium]|nr:hypothetical protein AGMMS49995_10910 [Endomicrobiia bacterium]